MVYSPSLVITAPKREGLVCQYEYGDQTEPSHPRGNARVSFNILVIASALVL